jgi:lipoate-protein ligase A
MDNWRLIHSGFQTGAMNMALDEVFLQAVSTGLSQPILRFYRWKPATVTIGYSQSIFADIDLQLCERHGLDVVRRSTGGRAVLHDNEVTYSVIAPIDYGPFSISLIESYRLISKILQQALLTLGLRAELVPGKSSLGTSNQSKAVCFSAPSQYELVIDNRKIAGSAQKRSGKAFIQHGSIPLDMDLALLKKILKVEQDTKKAAPLDKVGWLNHWTSRPLQIKEIESKISEEFSKLLNIQWDFSNPSHLELAKAKELSQQRYGNRSWNMMR